MSDSEVSVLHDAAVVTHLGARVAHTDVARYHSVLEGLRSDGFNFFVGLTGVDYLTHPGRDLPEGIVAERFEVVVELLNLGDGSRIRVRVQVPESNPKIPSAFDVWPGAEAHERETYDLFGIIFENHPDLSRILMPEDWEGHPLRKDYSVGAVPVQFKEAR